MGAGDNNRQSYALIEQNLRRVYRQTLDEATPRQFESLIQRLAHATSADSRPYEESGETR